MIRLLKVAGEVVVVLFDAETPPPAHCHPSNLDKPPHETPGGSLRLAFFLLKVFNPKGGPGTWLDRLQ